MTRIKRRRARFRRIAFIRRNIRILGIALFFCAAAALASRLYAPEVPLWTMGLIAVAFLYVLLRLLMETRHAENTMPAEMAQKWTANELHRLGKGGWHIFENVAFDEFLVQHIAAGPGGVITVETAIAMEPWSLTNQTLTGPKIDPLPRARRAAELVSEILQTLDVHCPVVPAVVVWGPGAPFQLDGQEVVDGVAVLVGKQAPEWRVDLRGHILSADDVAAIKEAIDDCIKSASKYADGEDQNTEQPLATSTTNS